MSSFGYHRIKCNVHFEMSSIIVTIVETSVCQQASCTNTNTDEQAQVCHTWQVVWTCRGKKKSLSRYAAENHWRKRQQELKGRSQLKSNIEQERQISKILRPCKYCYVQYIRKPLFLGDSQGRSLSAIIRTLDCVVHTHRECPNPKGGFYQFSPPSLLDFFSNFPYKFSNDNDDNDSRLLFGFVTRVCYTTPFLTQRLSHCISQPNLITELVGGDHQLRTQETVT